MAHVSDKSKILYLLLVIFFLLGVGAFWLDYIGLLNIEKFVNKNIQQEPESVLYASDDEPSLIAKEEFEKQQERLQERIEALDAREAEIAEKEKKIQTEFEKLEEVKKGLELAQKKLEEEKKANTGYKKNVKDLAQKIVSMPPDKSVAIISEWDEPLIIDVLRQMDADAEEEGRASITSYIISLMDKEKASRIMYLMTQL
jgi:flagellar protein FlbB